MDLDIARFDKPTSIKDSDRFAHLGPAILPRMAEIPEKYRMNNRTDPWVEFQHHWFFKGIDWEKVVSKPGIDKTAVLGHLGLIQRSFEPKHEHKVAAIAWLASLWLVSWK